MGRYSSVQAYADNNASNRAVPYEQATGSSEVKKGAVKAEKVVNPYGSTAGANSGDFHLYRHARARELERLAKMDQDALEQEQDAAFQATLEQNRLEEEQRTEKRRKKRQREKAAKLRKKNLQKAGISITSVDDYSPQQQEDKDDYQPTEKKAKAVVEEKKPAPKVPPVEIKNDGSFLEMMKAQLAAGDSAATSST